MHHPRPCLQAGHRVLYPGLKSHPQRELFKQLSNKGGYGAGGLLTLDLGTTARANALMESLQNDHGFGLMAVSLGCANVLALCRLHMCWRVNRC